MNIVKVCVFCITAVILITIVREQNKSIASMISIISGIIVMIYVVSNIDGIFNILDNLTSISKVESKYLLLILKISGITYLIEFGKNLCIDASESALGTKLEMAGKVMIVTLTLPILTEILEQIVGLL